jgi:hypothetical protein
MFTPELDTNKEHDPDDVAQLCCLPGREPRVVLPDWERRPCVLPNRQSKSHLPPL